MRPKKRVLLIDSNEERAGIMRLVLSVWQYKVISCVGAKAARRRDLGQVDFVICQWPVDESQVARLADGRGIRYVICVESRQPAAGVVTDAVLRGKDCTPANILEAVKFGTIKRRGPKTKNVRRNGDDPFSMFFQRLKQPSLLPPKKPPASEMPQNPELHRLEQDIAWFIALADTFTLGSKHRMYSERILRHLESIHRAKSRPARSGVAA